MTSPIYERMRQSGDAEYESLVERCVDCGGVHAIHPGILRDEVKHEDVCGCVDALSCARCENDIDDCACCDLCGEPPEHCECPDYDGAF